MRVAVWTISAADRILAAAVMSGMPELEHLTQPWASWPEVEAVLIVAETIDDVAVAQICLLQEQMTDTPMVLATQMNVFNLLGLRMVIVDAVVDVHAGPATLRTELQNLPVHATWRERRALAQRFRNAEQLPQLLRIGCARLAVAIPPFRSANSLARSLGCSTSTLRYHFAKTESDGRLEDLVDWFVLLHYGWSPTGKELSDRQTSAAPPSRRTLDLMARRLIGADRKSVPLPSVTSMRLVEALIAKAP